MLPDSEEEVKRISSDDEPFAALAFKIMTDPYVGQLTFLRIYSGAMSTGGLSHCDSNQMVRTTLMGLFDEWHTRIEQDYASRKKANLDSL